MGEPIKITFEEGCFTGHTALWAINNYTFDLFKKGSGMKNPDGGCERTSLLASL